MMTSQSSTKRYVCNKMNEIEILPEKKAMYQYNRTGDDIRWYAPEIVLKDVIQLKNGKNGQFVSTGTIAVRNSILFSVITLAE